MRDFSTGFEVSAPLRVRAAGAGTRAATHAGRATKITTIKTT
jgi:hypothetical protein